MNIVDILTHTKYYQKFSIFEKNDFEEYFPIIENTERADIEYEDSELLWHLNDKIVDIEAVAGNVLLIIVESEDHEKMAEERYDKKYVERWERDDPSTRPFRYCYEMPGCDKH